MSFFKRVGRQVEQFKQTAKGAAEEDADYRCQTCDARFHSHHDHCPECGAENVVSVTSEN